MLVNTRVVSGFTVRSDNDHGHRLSNGRWALVRELLADLETPLSVYLKLAGDGPSFLLESVSGGEQVARYSFIGVRPRKAYILRDRTWEVHFADGRLARPVPENENPLTALRQALGNNKPETVPGLPRLVG